MSRGPDVAINLSPEAEEIYAAIADLPIVAPHGHCEPRWFAEDQPFPNPAELLLTPDHYVFRMLYSQGVPLEALGVGRPTGSFDPRAAFRLMARRWHLFIGTPSHLWLAHTLHHCFGVSERLSEENADAIYDRIDEALASDAFRPRAQFDAMGIEALATTDGALDDLRWHKAVADSGWSGRIVPTFRPDAVLNPAQPGYRESLRALAEMTGCDTADYRGYLDALRRRRDAFRAAGATATDHDVPVLRAEWLAPPCAEALFAGARQGTLSGGEAETLYNHLLIEMAQMSADDGMVMQLHAGSRRSTNRDLTARFGPNTGSDIPVRTDWCRGLDEMLNRVGNSEGMTIIAFTLDESAYARELAPMAGHWPALRLGPPWWFHDSVNGIRRYFDQVVETAGYWNLAGFNDDTRAFLSIPARHDLWRRAVAIHLAEQRSRGVMTADDAKRLGRALARDLALDAYKLRRER